MSFYENLKRTSEQWNCFSKSDVLGSFDFMTLTISLDSLSVNDHTNLIKLLGNGKYREEIVNRSLNFGLYECLAKFYGLSYHEYTHFIDSTSTVWGANYLKALNDAYLTNHDIYGSSENEFYKAKYFFDLARSFRLPKYYTAISPGVDPSRPWSYQMSTGRRFDKNGQVTDVPVAFISFLNSKGERIVRSPLSAIAILEVSAVAQEILYKAFLANALEEKNRAVERAQIERETLSFIYDHELTEYTACAHLVANMLGLTDVLQTYRLCERLATVVLNFTDTTFEKIRLSEKARASLQLDKNDARTEAARLAFENRNIGYLFYIISFLLPKLAYSSKGDVVKGIDSALSEIGLSYAEVLNDARQKVAEISQGLTKSRIRGVSKISGSMLKNFDLKVGADNGMYNFSSFDLPPVLLGDNEVVLASPGKSNALSSYELEASYEELVAGQIWMERFSEACV